MCRIAGIVSKKSDKDQVAHQVSLMCDALEHGGPDDAGIFVAQDTTLVFGHRRLSIIDLSKNGHQPMADVGKKAWITFNGEIYNYLQLKQELLKAGAAFSSATDTEIILQAYLYWGTAAFGRLRGMFAFALYDIAKDVTYLVRDTTGIKPLYYHIKDEQLSFASEIRALKAAGIATQENPKWPISFLAYGHIPEPGTTLKDVYSLPKGHLLCWDNRTGTYTISKYAEAQNTTTITTLSAAENSIDETLKMAVKRQLIADATIGVFLSGGVDSSLLALLANNEKLTQLKTVSIFFDEKDYDESAYQQQVFEKIKGEKFTHLVKQQDFETFLPDVLNAMDMPTTDGINTWFISKYASEDGLKAVLSGIGGDELFGGYPSFNRIKYIKYLRSLPNSLLRSISHFTADKYHKLSFLTSPHPLADYLFLRGLFVPGDIAEILDCDEKEVYETLFSSQQVPNPGLTDQEKAAWFEINLYMQNQLLRDTDMMSMNHGLEVRVPLLDEDFQQVANSIAPGIRFDKKQPKKLLVDPFREMLPRSVWDRPKMGFSFPLQKWMGQHQEIANENLYQSKKAKQIIKKFKAGNLHWSKAFALYQIQKHV